MPTSQETSVTRIAYWQGYCHNPDIPLTPNDILKIHRLLQGDLRRLRYEKLHIDNLHSIRCTDERRLILTNVEIQHDGDAKPKQYLKVIGIAGTHNYDQIIRSHLSRIQAEEPLTFVQAEDIEAIEVDDGENISIIPNNQYVKLTRYQHHLLVLNADQEAARDLALPALITGPAGSGKTLSMLALLNSLIEDLIEKEFAIEKPIAIVTPKPALNKVLHDLWYCENNPLSMTPAGSQVVFLSEDDIYSHHAPVLKDGFTIISTDDFAKTIRTTLTKTAKNKHKKCVGLDNASLIHEFEIMAYAGSLETYLKLGERESYLSTDVLRTERAFLWNCFERVKENLHKQKKFSPYITLWNAETTFHAVLHDEAQAGYLNAKLILRNMAEQARYLLCAHSAQTTDKKLTDIPRFIQSLGFENRPLPVHTLTISYRNPLLVLLFSDYINRLKRFVAEGAPDKTDKTNTVAAELNAKRRGTLAWLPTLALATHLSTHPANDVKTVIITRKEFVQEAIQTFNTGHVVTSAQFGGQECDRVYLYKMTQCKEGEDVNAHLEHFHDDAKDNINLPKAGLGNFTFNAFFAEIYTACTRAKKEVTIVEEGALDLTHKRRHLIHHLQTKIADLNNAHPQSVTATPTPSTEASPTPDAHWLAKIEDYLQNNEIEVAKQIWEINLKRSPDDFNNTYFKQSTQRSQIPAANTKKAPPAQQKQSGKNPPTPKPAERIDYNNLPAVYAELDRNPAFIKTLCRDVNGEIPLTIILLANSEQFEAYFTAHPKVLLHLTTQDWMKTSSKSCYPLLLLVLFFNCKEAIPQFLSHVVIPANNYQLLAEITFHQMFLIRYQVSTKPNDVVSIGEYLLSFNSKTATHITIIQYFLIKHRDTYLKMRDKLWVLHHIQFEKPAHASLLKVINFDPAKDMHQLVEDTFMRIGYATTFNSKINGVLKYCEYMLTTNSFVKALTEYVLNPELYTSNQKTHPVFYRRLQECLFKIDFTNIVTLNGITAPFIFHLMDNPYSRLFIAHMFIDCKSALITRTRTENTLLVTQLLTKYPSRTLAVGDVPTEANCLEILKSESDRFSGICTLMQLFQFHDLLNRALEINPDFFFEVTLTPDKIRKSLLFILFNCFAPIQNTNGFGLLIALQNGLILKYAPIDFMLRQADNLPQRTFGHLLIQNPNFDFIDNYYEVVKEKISASEFANSLYAFLFETTMLTVSGYITTFTALRDLPHHRAMLSRALAFINAHLPVLREIDTALPRHAPADDLGEYDPINPDRIFQPVSAATFNAMLKDLLPGSIASILKRRDLLTLLFSTHPTTNKQQVLIFKTLMSVEMNAAILMAFLNGNPALLRNIFNTLRPMLASNQEHNPTYFEIFITDAHLSRLLEAFILNSPVYFFQTEQYLTYDFLLSNMRQSVVLHIYGLAKHAPNLLTLIATHMPHVLTDFPLSVWFPLQQDEMKGSLMAEIMTQTAGSQQNFADILRLQNFHLLKRLTIKELTTQTSAVTNHILSKSKRYSILDLALSLLKQTHDTPFHQYVFNLLLNNFRLSGFVKFLSGYNFANIFFMAQPQLFYFCHHDYFAREFTQLLPSLSLTDAESIFKTLGFTSAYIQNKKDREVWSALSVLILRNEHAGIPMLFALFKQFPQLIDTIPLTAWSNPENPESFVLLNRLRNNTVEPTLYDFMLANSSKVAKGHQTLLRDDVTHMLLTDPERAAATFPGRFFNQHGEAASLYDVFKFERTDHQP